MAEERADIAIIGGGAAGLAAAIFAGEAAQGRLRIVVVDGAKKLGAKILVSGGGRCNVTNERVTADDYWGGPRTLIRNVLRAFDEQRTIEWMRQMGVELKLEPTGKYFPVTDRARTVLDALLRRAEEVGIAIWTEYRVRNVTQCEETQGFRVEGTAGQVLLAKAVILATGGMALPKSGSDGDGLKWVEQMGHKIIPPTPALAPLLLAKNDEPGGRLSELSGVTMDLRLVLRDGCGKIIADQTGSTLLTHFGLSGPAPMNLSRHIARYRLDNAGAAHSITVGAPKLSSIQEADTWLLKQIEAGPSRPPAAIAGKLFPERYARLLCEDLPATAGNLRREQRLVLAGRIAQLEVVITGDRGYAFAEAMAGGVDLREVNIRTMESRKAAGLFLCGEILDVDGQIGGFNFQWAWATGYLAGRGVVAQSSAVS